MPFSVDRDSAAALLPMQYGRPGQLRQEYAIDAVLMLASEPAAAIAKIRPPVPVALMPSRTGLTSEQPTIDDVISTDRRAPLVRRSWTSGAPSRGNVRNVDHPYAEASDRNAQSSTGPVGL